MRALIAGHVHHIDDIARVVNETLPLRIAAPIRLHAPERALF
jgi:hypothetical protein